MKDPYEIPLPVWEDLVQDFLELACFLTRDEQDYLIQELQKEGVRADALEVYPSFSIDNRVVVVCEGNEARECWIYYPKTKKLVKS